MEEITVQQKNNRKKIILISAIAAVVVIAAVIIAMVMIRNSPARRLQRQLDLGNRYLSELQYDEAIAAFEAALEIDPMSAEAYLGLIDAYEGTGDAARVSDVLSRAREAGLSAEDLQRIEQAAQGALERVAFAAERIREEELAAIREQYIAGVLQPLWEAGEELDIMNGYGGIIPVFDMAEGTGYGAMDYAGNLVVPYEYDDFRSPNLSGYLVMQKGDRYELFDASGTNIYSGTDPVTASGNMYIVTHASDNWEDGDSYASLTYYYYDGTVALSLADENILTSYGNPANGFYEGKSMVIRVGGSYFKKENYFDGFVAYEYGFVNESGGVTWQDGDGYDESDRSLYYTQEEADAAHAADNARIIEQYGYLGADGVGIAYPPPTPYNGLNRGFYIGGMSITPVWELCRADRALPVVEVFPYGFEAEGDSLLYRYDTEFNGYPYDTPVYSGINGRDENNMVNYDAPYSVLYGYYYDGDWYYNYGSKAVISVSGLQSRGYALVDIKTTRLIRKQGQSLKCA